MNQGQYVFSQIISFVDHNDFNRCVAKYKGNYGVRHFTCWKQFLCLAFGQLTHRESMSDTVLCLNAHPRKLYHLGLGKKVVTTTLSRANESRDWRIYADLARLLVAKAQKLYQGDNQMGIDLKAGVFAIDASIIDLCLSVYPWAKFRKTKAAVKLHVQLDLKNALPGFVHITTGKVHEVNVLDLIDFEKNSFYIMDRGYFDFERLYKITLSKAFFIIRSKKNTAIERVYSSPVDKSKGLGCDQTVRFSNYYAQKDYPDMLRRIKYHDAETGKTLVFLTNNFELEALTVAQLYKHRWQIETFFKWIKQHLKIKSFWGHGENAVKTQIWAAIATYVIVAIVKKNLDLPQTMYEILQILSITIFDKIPVNQLFKHDYLQNFKEHNCNQLKMF